MKYVYQICFQSFNHENAGYLTDLDRIMNDAEHVLTTMLYRLRVSIIADKAQSAASLENQNQ